MKALKKKPTNPIISIETGEKENYTKSHDNQIIMKINKF